VELHRLHQTGAGTVPSVGCFLQEFAERLKKAHLAAKVRLRVAGTGRSPLQILTAKLWPSAPSIDILVTVLESDGACYDEASQIALDSTLDSPRIVDAIASTSMATLGRDLVDVYRGALRFIKLWAWRKHVYGASHGYLGGGGWSVVLARIMIDGLESGEWTPGENPVSDLLHYFYKKAIALSQPLHISCLKKGTKESTVNAGQTRDKGWMTVLAPVSRGNFGLNTTRSTEDCTFLALRHAAAALAHGGKGADLLLPLNLAQSLQSFASVSAVELVVHASDKSAHAVLLAELKARVASKLLWLSVELEQRTLAVVRLYPRPLRSRKKQGNNTRSLVWLIGYHGHGQVVLPTNWLSLLQDEWRQEVRQHYGDSCCVLSIQQYDMEVFLQEHAKMSRD
jgi:hypothetical protein